MMAAGMGVMSKTNPYVNHKHTGNKSNIRPIPAIEIFTLLKCPIMYICQYWFPQHHKSAKPNSTHIELHVADAISQVK